jgi:hypothetical protein
MWPMAPAARRSLLAHRPAANMTPRIVMIDDADRGAAAAAGAGLPPLLSLGHRVRYDVHNPRGLLET